MRTADRRSGRGRGGGSRRRKVGGPQKDWMDGWTSASGHGEFKRPRCNTLTHDYRIEIQIAVLICIEIA